MIETEEWLKVKNHIGHCRFCAIASKTETNELHLTPIGSVSLMKNMGRGFFMVKFTKELPKNLKANPDFVILATRIDTWFWLKSLFKGKFERPPAYRLKCRITTPTRSATLEEKDRFNRKVRPLMFLKGAKYLWSGMSVIQEFEVIDINSVKLGQMSAGSKVT